MLRLIALLSIVARCAAFGTFSAPGEVCIDEPAHLVAERTAAMGENYTAFTSCDVIAEAGGCDDPYWSATVQAACCAQCALPQRESRGKGFLGKGSCHPASSIIELADGRALRIDQTKEGDLLHTPSGPQPIVGCAPPPRMTPPRALRPLFSPSHAAPSLPLPAAQLPPLREGLRR